MFIEIRIKCMACRLQDKKPPLPGGERNARHPGGPKTHIANMARRHLCPGRGSNRAPLAPGTWVLTARPLERDVSPSRAGRNGKEQLRPLVWRVTLERRRTANAKRPYTPGDLPQENNRKQRPQNGHFLRCNVEHGKCT